MSDEQGVLPTEPLGGTPRARRHDPPESHAAAASVGNLTDKQRAVLGLLSAIGPCTDRKLVSVYQLRSMGQLMANAVQYPRQSESGVRTRRKELTDKALVVRDGTTTLESGRKAAVWRVVFRALT